MLLSRVTGPECPRCGCQDTETLFENERTGTRRPSGERVRAVTKKLGCRNCGHVWWDAGDWDPIGEEAEQQHAGHLPAIDGADDGEEYLIDKPTGERLWPSSWSERAADMLKADMKEARIAWIKNAPNTREAKARKESDFLRHQNRQGEVADFHATRHTYITTVATRFPSKLAQELARHSDGRLTDKYTHIKLAEAGAAVAQLPALSGVNNDDQHGDQSNDRNHPHGVAG